MISIENVTKSYGAHVLYDGISFKINPKERVGLVGRNGHGKTTLFRMIIGEETPDSGTISIPKNYRIGYVSQQLNFSQDTVLKEGMLGLPKHEQDHYWKVEKVLAGLGFSETDMQRPPAAFSGGYQVRLNLAKVLVSDPDLLLLDEPTNYLDITSIRWIQRFLLEWPRELLLITHDRGFMDTVVTHTVSIHRKKCRKIQGNTEKLYAQIAQEEEIYEKTRANDERKRKEIEQFINRFRAKARLANLVQSRMKTLEKMEKREKLEAIRDLEFRFRYKPFAAKHVMTVSDLSFSYTPNMPLIEGFNLYVQPGDRICIVGKNGKGKTTLIKLLAGVLTPDSGKIVMNPTVTTGFYEQTNVQSLVDSRTVLEEILYCDSGIDGQTARNICGAMMFEGDAALKKIGVLSGGEKSRVMLGKLLATPLNFLMLDEPTNHLDMASCDALLAALDDFEGVILMVTHNEMFLHALAQRLIVFGNHGISVFEGTYQEFLDAGGWEDVDAQNMTRLRQSEREQTDTPQASPRLNKKELRKIRSEIITRKSKTLRPIEDRIDAIETRIESHERQLNEFQQAMQQATEKGDVDKIVEISRAIHDHETAIETLFQDLEKETDRLETLKAEFEAELNRLETYE